MEGPKRPTVTRRQAIGMGAATLAGAALAPAITANAPAGAIGRSRPATVAERLRPAIQPRQAWAGDRPVVGPIVDEDDVRFLLVHHTASTNAYGPDEVTDQIRGFYDFHTSPEKGWPDVAYNFFIDRYGGLWEARAGSLERPVRGDATGGSQGHALLCSLIGNHAEEAPTPEAQASLVQLLAWLAESNGITTEPGTTVDFVSRGSNRWPEGVTVQAATISGHRDMSQTTCPGDLVYGLLTNDIPRTVTDLRLGAAAELASEAATTTTAGAASEPTLVPAESAPPTVPDGDADHQHTDPGLDDEAAAAASDEGGGDDGGMTAETGLGATAAALAAVTAGLAARRRRRQHPPGPAA